MSDEVLVARARKGDKEAFRGLVELYSALSERTARVLLHHREWAEDAVQEAWLDVWRGLPLFEPDRPFRPWLLTVVANRCRMEARKDRSRPQSVLLSEHPGSRMTPLGDEGTEWDGELEEALATLEEEQRHILALRFYADLKLDEIAEVMHLPLGTVKSKLYRALGALRTHMLEQLARTHEGNLR